MDSLSPYVVSAAKLPILNSNEFDLWKMRIEQYFLMTNYSLWEVILNGDSPVPTRVVEGSRSLSVSLRFMGVSLSQEDVNFKFLQSLPSEWKTHTLIWGNKADLEKQSLDDLFNSLKIYEDEVKHSSSTSTTTQNLAFVSSSNSDSTTESVSVAASVSAICAKMHVSSLFNVDSLSNAVIYSFYASQSTSPQLDNEDLKQIDVDDLKEMDLRWQMVMLTMRARRFLQKTGINLGANRPTSMGFDMSKVKCYNCYRKGHFSRECRSPKDSRRNEEELANYALMAFSSSSSSSNNESDCESWPPSSLYDRFQPSDGYHVVPPSYTGTFMPPKPDLVFNTAPTVVETDHLAFNVQLSPTKLEQDLSHPNRPSAPIIKDWVFDFKDESETKAPQIVPSFVQSTEQVKSPRHSVQYDGTSISTKPASPKPTSPGKRRNRKACFVCKSVDHLIKDCDYHAKKMAQPTPRNHAHRGNHKPYAQMTHHNPQKHMVPVVVLTQSKPVSITAVRPVSADVPKIKVTRPRHAEPIVTKSNSPTRRHITRSPSPKTSNLPQRVTADKASVVSATQGNMSYLFDFEELNGGYVAFRGNPKGGKISGKGKIKTGKLDFDDVYFVKELKFNLFSVSQMYDKKNIVLFTDTECLVLSLDFKLPDENQVLLKVPRENNMYNVNLKNIKGKKHRASCKTKPVSSVDQPLYRLHMDLFGPTFVKSLNKKSYCLIVIDDYSRSDNGTEFKNNTLNQFCRMKGIKREFRVPRTPQQNGIAERKNKTLIEAAITMLADSLLPIPIWAEAVNTACYVQNRVLVTKPHNKTPYELLHGKPPSIGFMKPFGCPMTILNTLDSLGKFDGNVDEGFLVGDSPNVAGSGPTWLFDIDSLTRTMNYQPVIVGNQTNLSADAAFDGKEHDFDPKKPESEVNVSPSSNASQLLDDHDMPKLEDNTYSDDEDDVGPEAVFNNLETSIIVSPISTIRVHKDHPVSQIIGDMSSTTQTRRGTQKGTLSSQRSKLD
nr:hypothetical protein [Tanacetum cinerariifolium]